MNLFIRASVASALLMVAGGTSAINCNQAIQIDAMKSVPPTVALFSGMNCADLELHREDLYIKNLSDISLNTFQDFTKWQNARNQAVSRLANARDKLEEARKQDASSTKKHVAITTAIHALGETLVIAGCPATTTGVGAVVCGAGLVFTSATTVYSLTSANYNANSKKAIAVLKEAENSLKTVGQLEPTELSTMSKAYLDSFNDMCAIVDNYCR